MNKEWYTTPKCTVAETVGHRIILTSNFNICQRQQKKEEVLKRDNLYRLNMHKSTRTRLLQKKSKSARQSTESDFRMWRCVKTKRDRHNDRFQARITRISRINQEENRVNPCNLYLKESGMYVLTHPLYFSIICYPFEASTSRICC